MRFSKKTMLLLAFMVVVVTVSVGCYTPLQSVEPKIIKDSLEERTVFSCTDVDGHDIYTKGNTEYTQDDGSGYVTDMCVFGPESPSRVGAVREGFCEDGKLKMHISTCGEGYICRQGACIEGIPSMTKCADSDGGKDIAVFGEGHSANGFGDDSCWSGNPETKEGSGTNECTDCYVHEFYCDGDRKEYEFIPCASCLDGVCIA